VGGYAVDVLTLAQHHLSTGQPEKALEELGHADGGFDDPEYWRISAAALHGLHRYEEALGAALQGLTVDPESVGLLDVRGLAELGLNEFDAGLHTINQALALAPTNVFLLAHRALALALTGAAVAARIAANELLELHPISLVALETRAQVARITADSSLERYVDELLAADPESRIGHRLRGNVAFRRRDIPGMNQAYAEAARLDPGNVELAKAARSARVLAHPALVPNRALVAIGRWRFRFIFFSLSLALLITHQTALRAVLVVAVIGLAIYLRIAKRLIKRAEVQKFGDV
jgi:tetratricopeptide (TPR) repeat protein